MTKKQYDWAGPNAAIVEKINDYCDGKYKPPFALMLNGQWGSGKTWLIHKVNDERSKARTGDYQSEIYVSLYGMKSKEEIAQSLYVAMHPIMGGKLGQLGKIIFKGLLKTTVKIDLSEIEKGDELTLSLDSLGKTNDSKALNAQNRVVIFDDLERANMDVSDILSLIQPLVECQENRVIIIANEEEIYRDENDKKERYKLIKEKTVYLTLKIESHIQSAFDAAIDKVSEGSFRDFINSNKDEFLTFFSEIKIDNLRTLSFIMVFGEELFGNIDEKYIADENREKIVDLIKFLYIIIFEQRIHNNSFDDLLKVYAYKYTGTTTNGDSGENTSLKQITEHMKSVGYYKLFCDMKAFFKIIYAFVGQGIFKKEEFSNILGPFFGVNEGVPSWKKLWFFDHYPENTYDDLIKEFLDDFENKIYQDEQCLHVCGIYLFLYKIGVDEIRKGDPIIILKKYLEKTLEEQKISDEQINFYITCIKFPFDDYQFGNLSYKCYKSKEFEELLIFYKYKLKLLLEKNLWNKLDYLISDKKFEGIKEFFRYADYSFFKENPFLSKYDVKDFFNRLKGMPVAERHAIFLRIAQRAKSFDSNKGNMKAEAEWIDNFGQLIKAEANNPDCHPLRRSAFDIELNIYENFLKNGHNLSYI